MTIKVKLTPAQRVALEHVRDEHIEYLPKSGTYWTAGWGKRTPRRDVLDRLRRDGLLRALSSERLLALQPTTLGLTDAGREALGAK